jgi:hypothetical protein
MEIAKAADAAALAAAAEINQRVFENSGDLIATSKTWSNAQGFASMNNDYPAVISEFNGGIRQRILNLRDKLLNGSDKWNEMPSAGKNNSSAEGISFV